MKRLIKFVVRFIITVVCLGLFFAQSFKEMQKYASGLTSSAIFTYQDENLTYPDIVLCHKEGFKTNNFDDSVESYINNTYYYDEIVKSGSHRPRDAFNVTEFYTYIYGRCYLLEPNPKYKYVDWMMLHLLNPSKTTMYIINKGQEICLIIGECNNKYQVIDTEYDAFSVYMTARKEVRPFR